MSSFCSVDAAYAGQLRGVTHIRYSHLTDTFITCGQYIPYERNIKGEAKAGTVHFLQEWDLCDVEHELDEEDDQKDACKLAMCLLEGNLVSFQSRATCIAISDDGDQLVLDQIADGASLWNLCGDENQENEDDIRILNGVHQALMGSSRMEKEDKINDVDDDKSGSNQEGYAWKKLRTLAQHTTGVIAFAWSKDKTCLFVAHSEGILSVHDANNTCLSRCTNFDNRLIALSVDPQGTYVSVVDRLGGIYHLTSTNGYTDYQIYEKTKVVIHARSEDVRERFCSWSEDGEMLAVANVRCDLGKGMEYAVGIFLRGDLRTACSFASYANDVFVSLIFTRSETVGHDQLLCILCKSLFVVYRILACGAGVVQKYVPQVDPTRDDYVSMCQYGEDSILIMSRMNKFISVKLY